MTTTPAPIWWPILLTSARWPHPIAFLFDFTDSFSWCWFGWWLMTLWWNCQPCLDDIWWVGVSDDSLPSWDVSTQPHLWHVIGDSDSVWLPLTSWQWRGRKPCLSRSRGNDGRNYSDLLQWPNDRPVAPQQRLFSLFCEPAWWCLFSVPLLGRQALLWAWHAIQEEGYKPPPLLPHLHYLLPTILTLEGNMTLLFPGIHYLCPRHYPSGEDPSDCDLLLPIPTLIPMTPWTLTVIGCDWQTPSSHSGGWKLLLSQPDVPVIFIYGLLVL